MKESAVIYMLEAPEPSPHTGKIKAYIGQTWDLYHRMYVHRAPSSECYALKHAINKYGFDNLKLTILHEGIETQEELDRLEIEEIKNRNTIAPNGYNLTHGGSRGRMSEESKIKLANSNRGKKRTQETRDKISKAHKGVKKSQESIAKHRATCAAKRALLPPKPPKIYLTKEQKAEIFRKASTGRRPNEETRAKMSAWQIGRKFSDETKKRMSLALQKTRVRCVETGVVYSGVTEAERLHDRKKGAIYHAIKKGGTCAGYHWEYVE